MALYPPLSSALNWTYDNWGTNPAATPGTSVVPGASDAEGSWTQIASSANIANDVFGFHIRVSGGATAATNKHHLLDIGVDPAGGTSYTAIISDLQVGQSPALTVAASKEFFFPFFIKAGSSVAVRAQGDAATAGTIRVIARFWGQPSAPWQLPVGTFSETFRPSPAFPSRGTSFTPGNAADGSWVDLGATAQRLWWWQMGHAIANTTVTAQYTYIEVAYGDGSNKHTILKTMHVGTTGETSGYGMLPQLSWHECYHPVPAGANIYIRGRCNTTPDTGYNASVIGIGG